MGSVALAQGGQTLLSADAFKALTEPPDSVHGHGHWRLKGVPEPIELFEVGEGERMRFAESMSSLMGGMGGGQVNAAMNRVHRLPGFPVQRVRPTGANESEVETLKKLERKALPKDLFTVPAGFTKEDPAAGRGPGRPPGRPR